MSINAYNASTISALFAGLNNSFSGTSLSYGIDFTTYNSIKNGSYSKLMRKYYSNQASESTDGATANKNTGKVHSIDIQKNNAKVNRDNAASLVDSASELKKYSLWSKVDKTDKDGNIAKEYDTDKIAKAVSSFVKDYNSLVSSTADSSSRYVLNSASNMVNYTRANADLLKKIGISVGSDNKLTVDEDKLKLWLSRYSRIPAHLDRQYLPRLQLYMVMQYHSYQNYLLRILIHLMDCIHTHLVIHTTSTHN